MMLRACAVVVLMLLGACSSPAERRQEALMDEIESTIHLPAGPRSLASYARYYAYDAPNEVLGVYMLPRLDNPPGRECEDLKIDGTSQRAPCSNAAREGKEVGADERVWLNDYHNLPMGDDHKCGGLSFVFDTAARRFKDVSCFGVASNPRAQPDQVRFFERPRAFMTARRSHTPLPVMVLLEENPRNMVLPEGPSFALYDDGTVIARREDGFTTAKLSGDEQAQFMKQFDFGALRRLYGGFEVATSTDQPSEDLLIYVGTKPIFISVYGPLADPLVRANVPVPIVSAYDTMKRFKLPRARKWLRAKFPHEELWASPNSEVK